MIKININIAFKKYKAFLFGDSNILSEKKCSRCGIWSLSIKYLYIIDILKKSELLDKNFKTICCECYDKNRKD